MRSGRRQLGWLAPCALAIATTGIAAADPPTGAPAGGRVELLHRVDSTVAVSSTVANARILPEHLVDGDPATAWNSRTGDLIGAWIAIRLPPTVHVDAIKIAAGFTHADPKGDLFTMNPRIRKVRVSRNGKRLLDHQLDIASRALQDLPIDAPGGDFRIEVLEIAPGSKPSWREICVSELEVWGTPPPGTPTTRTTPAVHVGSLDRTTVLGLRRTKDGPTLPLAVVAGGWVYLGLEDSDPGSGELRVERSFHEHAGPVIGHDLRRAIDPKALPPSYRGAQGMKVTVLDASMSAKCDGVLEAIEVAVEGELDPLPSHDPSDAERAAALKKIWQPTFAIAARLVAPCRDRAAWVRSAERPAIAHPASQEPPAWLAAAARKAFRDLASGSLTQEQARLARSPSLTYVPAAAGHPAYVAASVHIDLCHPGEFGAWGLWRVDRKQLTLVSDAHDDLVGAVDIDGDGKDEVITGRGEVTGDGYLAWWQDLTPFMPAGLGCDGHD